MNRFFAVLGALALASAIATLSGCDRPGHPKEISAKDVQSGVLEIFKSAPADVRKLATEISEAMQKQDFPVAWEKLQLLGQQTGLTPQQQEFLASGTASVGAEVNKAGQAGNEEAQKALEFHRANK